MAKQQKLNSFSPKITKKGRANKKYTTNNKNSKSYKKSYSKQGR